MPVNLGNKTLRKGEGLPKKGDHTSLHTMELFPWQDDDLHMYHNYPNLVCTQFQIISGKCAPLLKLNFQGT